MTNKRMMPTQYHCYIRNNVSKLFDIKQIQQTNKTKTTKQKATNKKQNDPTIAYLFLYFFQFLWDE